MKMSEKILLLRKKAGWSQEDLALELGVSRQSVYKWESEASLPEIDKIKAIAKLFNVSFDYLMDDEIEEVGDVIKESDGAMKESGEVSRAIEEKPMKPRKVYCAGVNLNPEQSDIDNGYVWERRVKPFTDNYYTYSRGLLNSAMQTLFIKEYFVLQPHSTTAYFYDEKTLIFGFYYAGKVQFACPIENLIDFKRGGVGNGLVIQTQVPVKGVSVGLGLSGGRSVGVMGGSMPAQNYLPSTRTDFSISYLDGGVRKEFKMHFSVETKHMINLHAGNLQRYNLILQTNMNNLDKNLQALEFKLSTLREEAKRQKDFIATLPQDGVERYKAKNAYFRVRYEELLNRMKEEAKQDNRRAFLRKTVKWIIILAILGISIRFFLSLFTLTDDSYARLLPTIFSKGKGFFSNLLK